jgi:hypothetical protein
MSKTNLKIKLDLSEFLFSFSSINTYKHCPYSFYLMYDKRVKRDGNFFSDYGNFIHSIVEAYFKGELDVWEMSSYYKNNFFNNINYDPPPLYNILNSYYNSGLKFFDNFDFDKDHYEIINSEEFIKGTIKDYKITIKPDLVFRNKETGETIIIDFKTSEIYKNKKLDEDKLKSYKEQLSIYIYFIKKFLNIEIQKGMLWFIRSNQKITFEYDEKYTLNVLEEYEKIIKKIYSLENIEYNNENEFYCNYLCSVRNSCQYKKPIKDKVENG